MNRVLVGLTGAPNVMVSSDACFLPAAQRHGAGAGSQRRPLIVVETREFLRGCLRCWLDSFCQEFEAMVIGDIEASLHDDALGRAAAVLIASHAPVQSGPWLERQVQWLRSQREDLPVMVIVDGNELAGAETLFALLGLQGFLPLSSSVDVAAAAIRLIVAGGVYFPRARSGASDAVKPILLDRVHVAAEPDIAIFTPRERAVLELLGRGLPNKIIAYELNMSLGTVKVHVHNIIAKFRVRNRTGAAVAARAMQFARLPAGLAPAASAKPMIGSAAAVAADL